MAANKILPHLAILQIWHPCQSSPLSHSHILRPPLCLKIQGILFIELDYRGVVFLSNWDKMRGRSEHLSFTRKGERKTSSSLFFVPGTGKYELFFLSFYGKKRKFYLSHKLWSKFVKFTSFFSWLLQRNFQFCLKWYLQKHKYLPPTFAVFDVKIFMEKVFLWRDIVKTANFSHCWSW